MGLLDTDLSALAAKKPRNSDRMLPGEELNLRGLLANLNENLGINAIDRKIAMRGLDGMAGGDLKQAREANRNELTQKMVDVGLNFNPAAVGVIKGGEMAEALNANHSALDGYLSESPNQVTLSKIVVPKEMRNDGAGTAFMNDLVDMADQQGKTVVLSPASDFGGNKARLVDFYKRFGFVQNKGKNRDFEINESMYRNPAGLLNE